MNDPGRRNLVSLHCLSTFAFLRRHSLGRMWLSNWVDKYAEFRSVGQLSYWPPKSCSLINFINSKYIYNSDLQMFYPCVQFNWLWTQVSESEGINSLHDELWGFMSTNGAHYFRYTLKVLLFPPQPHYYLILSIWQRVVSAKFNVFCPEISKPNISNPIQ